MHYNGMSPFHCAVCGEAIAPDAMTVATADGALAHRVCADREAGRHYARRSIQVAVSAVLFSNLILLIVLEGVRGLVLAALVVSLLGLHLLLHRHWWRQTLPVRWQRPFWRIGQWLYWW